MTETRETRACWTWGLAVATGVGAEGYGEAVKDAFCGLLGMSAGAVAWLAEDFSGIHDAAWVESLFQGDLQGNEALGLFQVEVGRLEDTDPMLSAQRSS